MITEDYVSFEVAKLLNEKGFDEFCRAHYSITNGNLYHEKVRVEASGCEMHNSVLAPTLQMAMKWLREVHNIFIGVNTVIGRDKNWGYEVFIQKQEVPIPSRVQWDWFNTYEEACEAAIKHCLKNLI